MSMHSLIMITPLCNKCKLVIFLMFDNSDNTLLCVRGQAIIHVIVLFYLACSNIVTEEVYDLPSLSVSF